MLGNAFEMLPKSDVARIFGGAFADELETIGAGNWAGPVMSGYGQHLVILTERVEAFDPPSRKYEIRRGGSS